MGSFLKQAPTVFIPRNPVHAAGSVSLNSVAVASPRFRLTLVVVDGIAVAGAAGFCLALVVVDGIAVARAAGFRLALAVIDRVPVATAGLALGELSHLEVASCTGR